MPGGESDEKPFKCSEHNCGQSFTNEDHLNVHKLKHQMSLTLTPGTERMFLFADQTPTPTKFLRYGEEVGLFNDLKNPFDDAFKQATDDFHKHGKVPTPTTAKTLGLPHAGNSDQYTLNTPTPHFSMHNRQPDTPDTPIKKRYRFLTPDTEYMPLPEDSGLGALSTQASAGSAGQVDEVVAPSSVDTSVSGPASQESQVSILDAMDDISQGPSMQNDSNTQSSIVNHPPTDQRRLSSSYQFSQKKSPLCNDDQDVVLMSPQSTTSVATSLSQPTTTESEKAAKRPTTLSGIVPRTSESTCGVGDGAVIAGRPAAVEKTVTNTPTPLAILPLNPASSVSTAVPMAMQSATGSPHYMLQVMVQTSDGKMVPVQIPAALAQNNSTPAVTSPVRVMDPTGAGSVQPTVVAGGSLKMAPQGGVVKHSDAVTSTKMSTNASMLTKRMLAQRELEWRKLKEVIQQNSPSSNKVFISSSSPTGRTASTSSSQFSPSYSNPPTPGYGNSVNIQYQDADSSFDMPSTTSPSSNMDDNLDDKRRKFLERNRAAAARCRNKKKKWVNNLESKADELQAHNKRLNDEVASLKAERNHLKTLLLAHKDCPITIQQRKAGQFTLQNLNEVKTSDIKMVPIATLPLATTSITTHQQQQLPTTVQQIASQGAANNARPVMQPQFVSYLPDVINLKQEQCSPTNQTISISGGGQRQFVTVDFSKLTQTSVPLSRS